MTMIIDGSLGTTFPDSSLQPAAASPYTLKNKIINGDMVIDQRNAGASVTITSTGDVTYTLDRWAVYGSAASKFSVQQDAGAVTPPVGFNDYLGVTSLAATSLGSGDQYFVVQRIEGYNIADLGWGTANAKTVTLSFWVRSSLTGTFGGSLNNDSANRSYPFSYTISSANTWEQKTITIAGDTSGTWLTTNGVGLQVRFGLGIGTTYSGTAGAWAGSILLSSTGATSVVGTNAATWYVTGTQLEVGTSATPFERRLYNQELAACQRYTQVFGGNSNYNSVGTLGIAANSTQVSYYSFPLATQLRANPSLSYSGNWRVDDGYTASYSVTSIAIDGIALNRTTAVLAIGVASGLTSGRAYQLQSNNNTTARIILSSEL